MWTARRGRSPGPGGGGASQILPRLPPGAGAAAGAGGPSAGDGRREVRAWEKGIRRRLERRVTAAAAGWRCCSLPPCWRPPSSSASGYRAGSWQSGTGERRGSRWCCQRRGTGTWPQHLLLTAGQSAAGLPFPFPKAGKETEHPLHIFTDVILPKIRADADFPDRQIRKTAAPFRRTSVTPRADDLSQGSCPVMSSPFQKDGALGLHQTGNGPQRGGFARAVCANQSDDLPLRHLKGDALDGLNTAVGPCKF